VRNDFGKILCMLCLFALATACNRDTDDRRGTNRPQPIGIRLELSGMPSLEVAVDVFPAVPDKGLVKPVSELLGRAVMACKKELLAPKGIGAMGQARMTLLVVQGKVQPLGEAGDMRVLERCLLDAMAGAELPTFSGHRRRMELAMRLASTMAPRASGK